ncbi:MAG: hypothetical protein V4664_01395 [Patescibacteria group bacterium]
MKENAPVPHEVGKAAFERLKKVIEKDMPVPDDLPEERAKLVLPPTKRIVTPARPASPPANPRNRMDAHARWEQEREKNEDN